MKVHGISGSLFGRFCLLIGWFFLLGVWGCNKEEENANDVLPPSLNINEPIQVTSARYQAGDTIRFDFECNDDQELQLLQIYSR
jgi:hypothetical protein